ncbi:hypothetical protein HMI54_004208 [Coelomomyces lativittatus]|nr:hypothetical protein HMI56_004205 [Coelomomyces lativittatus]KAJ1507432.1 hypothetical protein HMI54_004208 [Coelomomyces lativittatus]
MNIKLFIYSLVIIYFTICCKGINAGEEDTSDTGMNEVESPKKSVGSGEPYSKPPFHQLRPNTYIPQVPSWVDQTQSSPNPYASTPNFPTAPKPSKHSSNSVFDN